MFKNHTILTLFERRFDASPLFAFQKYIIAEKENIKMQKLETLFMLVNAVLY